ncbi:MAG: hypothetical protein AAGA66_15655 [Bacteroidota bacterium]
MNDVNIRMCLVFSILSLVINYSWGQSGHKVAISEDVFFMFDSVPQVKKDSCRVWYSFKDYALSVEVITSFCHKLESEGFNDGIYHDFLSGASGALFDFSESGSEMLIDQKQKATVFWVGPTLLMVIFYRNECLHTIGMSSANQRFTEADLLDRIDFQ